MADSITERAQAVVARKFEGCAEAWSDKHSGDDLAHYAVDALVEAGLLRTEPDADADWQEQRYQGAIHGSDSSTAHGRRPMSARDALAAAETRARAGSYRNGDQRLLLSEIDRLRAQLAAAEDVLADEREERQMLAAENDRLLANQRAYQKACESQGLPIDCPIDMFVQHHRGNAGLEGYARGYADAMERANPADPRDWEHDEDAHPYPEPARFVTPEDQAVLDAADAETAAEVDYNATRAHRWLDSIERASADLADRRIARAQAVRARREARDG